MEWPKVTLFGDSITRRSTDPESGCWGSMITYQVNNYFDVDIRGFSGYNTKWALELMPKLFPRSYLQKVELFVEFFGHNDSWEDWPQQVRLDQFERNLESMIEYLISHGLDKRKIVLITPSWYNADDWADYRADMGLAVNSKSFEHTKKYSDAVLRVGEDLRVDVLDFFTISSRHQPLGSLFCDGLHFSRLGAELLYESLMPVIRRKIEVSFKKPLVDLVHATPIDQQYDFKVAMVKQKRMLNDLNEE